MSVRSLFALMVEEYCQMLPRFKITPVVDRVRSSEAQAALLISQALLFHGRR